MTAYDKEDEFKDKAEKHLLALQAALEALDIPFIFCCTPVVEKNPADAGSTYRAKNLMIADFPLGVNPILDSALFSLDQEEFMQRMSRDSVKRALADAATNCLTYDKKTGKLSTLTGGNGSIERLTEASGMTEEEITAMLTEGIIEPKKGDDIVKGTIDSNKDNVIEFPSDSETKH